MQYVQYNNNGWLVRWIIYCPHEYIFGKFMVWSSYKQELFFTCSFSLCIVDQANSLGSRQKSNFSKLSPSSLIERFVISSRRPFFLKFSPWPWTSWLLFNPRKWVRMRSSSSHYTGVFNVHLYCIDIEKTIKSRCHLDLRNWFLVDHWWHNVAFSTAFYVAELIYYSWQ